MGGSGIFSVLAKEGIIPSVFLYKLRLLGESRSLEYLVTCQFSAIKSFLLETCFQFYQRGSRIFRLGKKKTPFMSFLWILLLLEILKLVCFSTLKKIDGK